MARIRTLHLLPAALLPFALLGVASLGAEKASEDSLFAPSQLTTRDGKRPDPDLFFEAADCGECHVQQYKDWRGSMHSRAHHDGIYLAFAKLARKEGGEALYVFCSSCHAPAAIATGELPGDPKARTFLTDEGVTCDACHTAADVRLVHGAGGANASIVLDLGDHRYGTLEDPGENLVHESATAAVHAKSEFCSACHTLIHPHNGLVIENTFEEWSKGPYAKAGIQCQDCHMRSISDAQEVARTMKPVATPGRAAEDGPERKDIKRHLFVGANVNAEQTGGGEFHAAMARDRLRGAATIAIRNAGGAASPGGTLAIEVAVTNESAGHSIPTSITELRQVWIDLAVSDSSGRELLRSGAIDAATGALDPEAVLYNAVLVDAEGKVTFKPWLAVRMIREKLIPAKQTVTERYELALPKDAKLPLEVRAVLRYRSAPQDVMDRIFGKGAFRIEVVDMCAAELEVR